MMTGQIKMDNSTSDKTANLSAEVNLQHEVPSDTNIATLDVTSEEIYCTQKGWSSLSSFKPDTASQTDSEPVERKRSETWTYGLANQASMLNGDELVKDKFYLNEQRRSSIPDRKADGESLNVQSSFLQMHSKSMANYTSHSNSSPIPNGSIPNQPSVTVEDESEFTDVNLAQSSTTINETMIPAEVSNYDENLTVSEIQPRKQTLGSLFEWISASRNDSFASAVSVDVVVSKSSATPPSSPSSPTSKYSGIKIIQKTLKSTFSRKNPDRSSFEPFSTTALILENRPSNLPSKSTEEAVKHRTQYDKMVENAKKSSLKDLKKRKQLLKQQEKLEKTIVNSSQVWLTEILPHWQSTYQSSKTRQLWWQGLPPNVRGKVWQLAIRNELNITNELYSIMVTRAHDKLKVMSETQSYDAADTESLAADRECTVELIRLDISRTFPHLCIFQRGGPYHELLHDVLGAYACYRPDVGYVQGMSFMAAMLLLNMEPAEAFVTFANLLNKPCQIAFFRLNEEMMQTYFASFEVFFEENLPKLFARFKQNNLTPDMYLIDWIFTMFSKGLDLDTASRIWDVFCRDGEEFLFRTAIAILKLNSELLLPMEFIHAAQYLTRLPSTFTHQELFDVISIVTMTSRGGRRWKDVLSLMRDAT